jgi:hypothetical protein
MSLLYLKYALQWLLPTFIYFSVSSILVLFQTFAASVAFKLLTSLVIVKFLNLDGIVFAILFVKSKVALAVE